MKERAIGKLIPVIATALESARFAFKERKLVSKPPICCVSIHDFEDIKPK